MALSRLLKRRWVQLLSAALLAAALVLCGLAAGPLYQMRGLFLGDGAVSGLWGGLLRAAQYARGPGAGRRDSGAAAPAADASAVRGGGALGLCLVWWARVGPADGDGRCCRREARSVCCRQSRPGA